MCIRDSLVDGLFAFFVNKLESIFNVSLEEVEDELNGVLSQFVAPAVEPGLHKWEPLEILRIQVHHATPTIHTSIQVTRNTPHYSNMSHLQCTPQYR